ncbi:hypothetical protein AJ85_14725 [Alkalihalobacillus alcalophilus ATCC 27647 = CGMCC 1.3604]|uniref:UVR domain-containing protein n=1 Tax=Alkalihalobacillus alcalophilus ATCC 27647 = CGMCC 1.3604 TaxID=1218173 RepID=A0A094YXU2_ALKAL|nr:UvrB/UvrC motif-containing protein [Alkalihalobacillus alcalophilus]KGA98347.1 hypothetical protein BALCAV_0205385 [Alkalihalobacillus alcalophilus ATCC 27647 = CGMCC 1.3604]MED1561665.1 UvrB/UvrC motif-containing protein [Alkalihalobacillus alcalophilus]THG89943.1 hypothetical protein AJ85_14725 [Alkalihalobacillus alcalophilus ATCC 27647 = CGMCC 1.3604]
MKCQDCQERPATLHFTKIINGEKTEFHICEQCAREKGEQFPGTNSFSIHQLLSGLLNFEQPVQGKTAQIHNLTCENCGMTYEQFTRIGRFGCAHCYESFESKLEPILKRVHSGNKTHTGKIPNRIGGSIQLKRKINALKEEMKRHIEHEEFEQAAQIRDEMKELTAQLNEQEEG